jgi:hypothetical protein
MSKEFFRGDYQTIVDFFSGNTRKVSSSVIKRFTSMKLELSEVFEAFQRNKQSMSHSYYWEILEVVEEIDSKLTYLDNINRWSRSSLTSVAYTSSILKQHTLQQNQSLEKVAVEYYGPQSVEQWLNIALTNHLREDDYDQEGGISLNIELDGQVSTGLKLTSVVDVLYGKSIYGKDIYQRLTITGDDLQVLDYDSTLLQSVDILVNLRRNSNPDFPNLGRQTQLLVGSTRASFNFPIVDRDLKTVFASDDSLKDFQLTKLERVEDNVTISFQVYSRLNELQQLTRNI